MLNAAARQAMTDLDKKRDIMAEEIAREIIKLVPQHIDAISLFEQDQTKLGEMYKPIFEKILSMMLEKDVPLSYLQYIFGLIQVAFQRSHHYVSLWANTNMDMANAIPFGKESHYDVTFKDLASYLDTHKEEWLKILSDSKKAIEEQVPEGSVESPFVGQ